MRYLRVSRIFHSLAVTAGTLTGFVAARMMVGHGDRKATEQPPGAPSFELETIPRSTSVESYSENSQDALASYITKDGDGDELDGSEHYRIIGPLDVFAAWWSITLYDRHRALIPNADERHAFTNFNVIPEDDGHFIIDVAPERPARVTNWLPCQREAQFCVCTRLYRAGTHDVDGRDVTDQLQIVKVR